jgi:uncharacterized protein (TIGR02217 family)
MAFLETPRFPDDISYNSMGGPMYNTSIVVIRSGHESRNVNWTYSRHEYDVAYGVKTITQLYSLIEYFHAVAGMAYGFRYKDFMDCKSSGPHTTAVSYDDQDCDPATGDDVETDFQLIKTYTKGAFSRTRNITKPVSGTVRVSINGAEKLQGDATYPWSVDTTTGIITFSSTPPPNGESVKAGYEFDVPCRFDVDRLSTNYEAYEQGSTTVPLTEIRDIT